MKHYVNNSFTKLGIPIKQTNYQGNNFIIAAKSFAFFYMKEKYRATIKSLLFYV